MKKRKLLMILFLSFLIFFIFAIKIIFAQTPNSNITGNPIPGVDCGMASAPDGKDKCCYMKYSDLPDFSQFEGLPGAGGYIGNYNELKGKYDRIKNLAQKACILGEPTTDITDPNCKCILSLTPTAVPEIKRLCEIYLTGDERSKCENCSDGGALWTGIGCLSLTVSSLINDYLLKIGVGLGGVLALFCIIYAAFQIQTSQGSPEKIKKGQELLTSCIMGLMLIIFSVFILRLIGVDILKMPGFGR